MSDKVKVKEDLTGRQFGYLTVIEQTDDYITPSGNHLSRWLCQCSCPQENQIKVVGSKLKNGHTQSCGCLQKERTAATNKKINLYSEKLVDDYGEYYVGYTSNTNKEFYVDADDFEIIKQYCWYKHINKYNGYHSLRTKDPTTKKDVKLNYLVAGKYYDHIDRNPLNNRKHNLRVANASENMQNSSISTRNTSGVIGVSWDKNRNKWHVQISVNKNGIHIGRFANKEDAIVARLQAEKEYYGEFAPQKHLFAQYKIN